VSELGESMWLTAPVLSGAALRLSRPPALRDLIRRSDVTIVEFPWQFDAVARHAGGRRLVLSTHNVEVEKFTDYARAAGRRLRAHPWLRLIERMERRAVARADLILAVSEPDRVGLIERYGADPDRVAVAPNGADVVTIAPARPDDRIAAHRSLDLPEDRPVVLFVGADVTPNRRGLEWVRELARRTDRYTFLVVGWVGGRARREGSLVFTGFVEDLLPCLAAADIAICPIEFGGGTKIKLIESLAAGLPTVAFEHALLGMDIGHGEHVFVANRTAESLLDALDLLTADRELAARLGTAGRRHVEEHHDWRAIAEDVEEALLELVEGQASTRAAPRSAAPRG
jgi:glycosyltransferase involved in cell wall biosynthesis